MPITYASVSQSGCILAEYASDGNHHDHAVSNVLANLPEYECKMTFVQQSSLFHCLVVDTLTYMCIADEESGMISVITIMQGRRVPFAFLEATSKSFRAKYKSGYIEPVAYSLNEYSKSLSELMNVYNGDESDSFRKVQVDIDNVKEIMVDNIGMFHCYIDSFKSEYWTGVTDYQLFSIELKNSMKDHANSDNDRHN